MRIAIASGKGGTGKTFVAVNLFRTLKEMGCYVALLDCDVEVPNALAFFPATLVSEKTVTEYRPIIDTEKCTYCGRCVEFCEYHAIFHLPSSRYIRLLDDLCHGCAACSVACTYGAITDSSTEVGKISSSVYKGENCLVEGKMTPGHPSPVPLIKTIMSEEFTRNFECALFDSPPGTSCSFIQTVARVDYVVLVTEPTPFGLSDLKQAVDTLLTIKKPFGVVVNRAGLGDRQVYDYLAENRIDLLAEIPFEEEIARLYSEGKMIVDNHVLLNELFQRLAVKLLPDGNSSN